MGITVRPATRADLSTIQAVVTSAARGLLKGVHWTPAQVAAAEAAGLFAVDGALVTAGTYYVVEIDGAIAGGSGWSAGGAVMPAGRAAPVADDIAVMRASYVDPAWARRGLATLLARTTETAARIAGFTRFEALCTPPSEALRRRLGYELAARESVEVAPGITLTGARMRKVDCTADAVRSRRGCARAR